VSEEASRELREASSQCHTALALGRIRKRQSSSFYLEDCLTKRILLVACIRSILGEVQRATCRELKGATECRGRQVEPPKLQRICILPSFRAVETQADQRRLGVAAIEGS
jgi:hypothetical protein